MPYAATFRSNSHGLSVSFFKRLPKAYFGLICAWIAVIIYAASNSIVVMLVSIGEAMPVAGGRNAITFANLLLAGSVLSIIPIAVIFRRDLTRANFRQLSRRDWGYIAASSFLSSAVTPGLFFYALAQTSVTNVVLITRIEPPLFLLATWFILNERFSCRAMSAGLVALSGAVLMISLRGGADLNALGKGEWATIAATLTYIASMLVTRKSLRSIPIGVFLVSRTLLGATIYFGLVSLIAGPEVFRDIFSPVLWTWVWLYAGVVLVLAQIAMNMALKHARAETLALATSFSPLAAILIAMILLSEAPGPGFVPGSALILLSIFLSCKRSAKKANPTEKGGSICASYRSKPSLTVRRHLPHGRGTEPFFPRPERLGYQKWITYSRRVRYLKLADAIRSPCRALGLALP